MEKEKLKVCWELKAKFSRDSIKSLSRKLNDIDDKIAELLLSKNIDTFKKARAFFRPDLSQLHDPFLMKDMQKAVPRIVRAINEKENILVYGDYDVDGTTSVAMMFMFLLRLTKNAAYYIPDRYKEGYGISNEGIQYAIDNEISLIISLDCGIRAIEKIKRAQTASIDVIVCDHHLPGEILPDAFAILDVKQPDCSYPYKELSGCGVGFKLIQALCRQLNLADENYLYYIDLVAVSIAADIVPITGENRVLAHYGLKKLKDNPNIGLSKLLSEFDAPCVTISDVVFKIAPKINAAGRIEHASLAVELLCTKDSEQVKVMTEVINNLNVKRKKLDAEITQEALNQIIENKEDHHFTSVVYNKNWHKGVLGIVASRMIEHYYRPTIVFAKSHDKMVASARSVKGFNIYEALCRCSKYLVQFGGHKYAAGLTLYPEHYAAFKEVFEQEVHSTLPKSLLTPKIVIDIELDFVEITPKFLRVLKQFAPFGPGNMNPVFLTKKVFDTGYAKKIGNDQKHLKMNLKQLSTEYPLSAVGFGLGHILESIQGKSFDMVYTIEENYWQGVRQLQLNIKDISIS